MSRGTGNRERGTVGEAGSVQREAERTDHRSLLADHCSLSTADRPVPRSPFPVPTLLALLILLATPGLARAQTTASLSYIPVDHWSVPFVEHLIARGAVRDPSPMVRPWTAREVAAVLGEADVSRLSSAERATVDRLVAVLDTGRSDVILAAEAHAGVRAATHARRGNLREEGPGKVLPRFGANLDLQFKGGLLSLHPYFDPNLEHDPDYGSDDQSVWVRIADTYASYRSKYFEVDVGNPSRNWGPVGFPGLLVSSEPYGYDHLYVELGPDRAYLQVLVAQLDTITDRNGEVANRYWIAHRLTARPWKFLDLAIWEGTVVAGPNRTLEMWYLNPVRLAWNTRFERGTQINSLLGGDAELRLASGVRIAGSLTLDDLQFPFFGAPSDDEPPSYAITATVTAPVGPAVLWLGYTQVSNLIYRTHNPAEGMLINRNTRRNHPGTGLARNFTDYDQTTLKLSAAIAAGLMLTPELTLLRQGEGDLRDPYPEPSEYPNTPRVLSGVVEKTWRAALQGSLALTNGLSAELDAGLHYVTDSLQVAGETRTDFVASLFLRWALGGTLPIR